MSQDSTQIYQLYLDAEHISTVGKLRRALRQSPEVIACDTETTGLDFHADYVLHGCGAERWVHGGVPFGISLAIPLADRVALCWARRGTRLWNVAIETLGTATPKSWHNARYDLRVCDDNDLVVGGKQYDTLTMSRIWWDRRKNHTLESLTEMLCPHLCDWEEALKKTFTQLKSRSTREGQPEGYCNYSLLPDEMIGRYAKVDAFMGLILWARMANDLVDDQVYLREMEVLHRIKEVEKRGLAFNSDRAREEAAKMQPRIEECRIMLGDINPGSPAQVLEGLLAAGADRDDLRVKGKLTTAVEVLKELVARRSGSPAALLAQTVLEYRALTKTVNTYLLKLADMADRQGGIIYTTINPSDTRTARMASKSPNLQNLPTLHPRGSILEEENPTRSCFGPRDGMYWYLIDYAQMEMALFGWYTGDDVICAAYAECVDIHEMMATRIYGVDCTPLQRTRSKSITFGALYGMQGKKLIGYLGIPKKEAEELLNHYHKTFPSIHEFQDELRDRLDLEGYVQDWFGRRYHLPSNQAYKAVNALVQGGCGQAYKEGFNAIDRWLGETGAGEILLPVHDESIIESTRSPHTIEADEMLAELSNRMEEIPQLMNKGYRLRVDVKWTGTTWADKQAYEET